ncbi:transcription antitermination factor NusB [Desulfovibrio mangrovi]|uniref:transcription antitermination factor NusB n=1 Tax=Desulfovibrio mangrovi TaxID=2976983 RepID=UPI0022465C88|nr:transcription antitermination factor NusB [Desulfovibrio mangrovi]UZP67752.1 transcription antitermination factor NusB [Desulfovibrio mangrovi]
MTKEKTPPRRLARAQAFQILYGLNFSPVQTLEALAETYAGSPDNADKNIDPTNPEGFAWELIEGVWSNHRALDEVIAKFAKNWRVERIGKIEITLLRLAVYEMLYRQDVPPKVAINEAIELSKQFGDEKSRNFVNGILDAAAKAVQDGSLAPRTA